MKKNNFNNFLILVIALVMLNNVEHCAYVHHMIGHRIFGDLSYLHSVGSVLIIELAIFAFVVKGQRAFAIFFTCSLFVLCMLYYDLRIFLKEGNWEHLTAAFVYSLLSTVTIYMFSEMYGKRLRRAGEHEAQARFDGIRKENQALRLELEEMRKNALKEAGEPLQQPLQPKSTAIGAEINGHCAENQRPLEPKSTAVGAEKASEPAHVCEGCGKSFAKPQGLSAHKKHCKGQT